MVRADGALRKLRITRRIGQHGLCVELMLLALGMMSAISGLVDLAQGLILWVAIERLAQACSRLAVHWTSVIMRLR